MEGLKRCFVCKEWLSFDSFCKDKNRLDGLQPRCRLCCAECYSRYHKDNRERMIARVAEYRKNNKDKRVAYSKEYYKKNKKEIDEKGAEYRKNNKAKSYARGVRYREENKEKVCAREKIYRENNQEKIAARASKYQKKNKGIVNAITAKRRAGKIDQTPEGANLTKIQLYYAVCSETNDILSGVFFHVDHIQPLSKGGLHHEDNLQILEASLNLSKGVKWPLSEEDILKYRGITL